MGNIVILQVEMAPFLQKSFLQERKGRGWRSCNSRDLRKKQNPSTIVLKDAHLGDENIRKGKKMIAIKSGQWLLVGGELV